MFNIEMLPADHGDCLWIEYGDAESPYRILIDGGTAHSYEHLRRRIESLPPRQRRFELLIVTHLDADHIGGSLSLLTEIGDLNVRFGDVWFNGWDQIAPDALGYKDAKKFSEQLLIGIDEKRLKWNAAFGGRAAVVPENEEATLPRRKLKGEMQLTLLSPTRKQLVKLREKWPEALREAGLITDESVDEKKKLDLIPGALGGKTVDVDALINTKFKSDKSVPNGSSIAVLAEYNGKSCLLTGDAFATTLTQTLQRLMNERGKGGGKFALDAIKLPHHGSRGNVNKDLLDLVKCRRYLFSTNGNSSEHPDQESVARVITYGGSKPQLFFNYKTIFNEMWDDSQLIKDYGYRITFCKQNEEGFLRVEL